MLHAPRLMFGDPVNSGASIGAPNAQRSHSLSLPHSQQPSSSSAPSYPPTTATLTSNRTSPLPPTSSNITNSIPTSTAPTPTTNPAMAASILYASMPGLNGQTYMKPFARPYERDLNYQAQDFAGSSVIIRGLEANITEKTVQIMLYFSTDLVCVELLPPQDDDPAHRSALLRLKSHDGAQEVMKTLHGKNGLSVEYASQRGQTSGPSSSGASSATSPTTVSTQMPRFDGTFSPLDKTSPPIPTNGLNNNLSGPRPTYEFNRNFFSPQSPIGGHLSEQPRITGKSLINDATDDDDTGDILKDPRAYAENGALAAQRRATAPNLDLATRMSSLSLNTGANVVGMPQQHGGSGLYHQPRSAHPSTMSPTTLNGPGSIGNYNVGNAGWGRVHAPPPANPADQNPPCNTLYVGNLPIGTSEDELKALFTRQRGYKRLCFRAKANGPMCFVEFDDVSFATKALHDLYGVQLTNSVKGGIRLSFSKNPLGIRGNQMNGQNTTGSTSGPNGLMGHSTNGFATANGPPPGLSVPPGLGSNRNVGSYMASNLSNGNTGTMNTATFPPSTQANGANNNAAMFHGLANYSRNNPWGPSDGYFNNAIPTTNGVTSPVSGGTNGATPFGGYRRGHF